MKVLNKVSLFLVATMMFFGSVSYASEVEIQFLQMTRIADEEKYQVGNWQGIQLDYTFDNNIYVFGSYETAQIIPLWGIGDMSLIGAGAGFKHNLSPRLSLFGQLGYYFVSHENEGRHPSVGGGSEGMLYYFNDKYGFSSNKFLHFDEYYINYENAIGGVLGINYTYPVSKSFDVGFSLSYRSLKIPETLRVMRDEWDFENTGACWEQEITRNYSSINYGISTSYRF